MHSFSTNFPNFPGGRSFSAEILRFIAFGPGGLGVVALGLVGILAGCGSPPEYGARMSQQELACLPGGGGDLGCSCTLNSQCSNFDDDTRLIVCNVASGATSGSCFDCLAAAAGTRPVGCACTSDSDCDSSLKCNGRTCQPLRQRGEYCFHDSDCGSDMSGSMTCLPTKSWCGPLAGGHYCDYNTDCLSGRCYAGLCTPGSRGAPCASDSDCTAPQVCGEIQKICISPQPDGQPCMRNVECINQCNSFSGVCLLGQNGVICTLMNHAGPNGDCESGLDCTDCGGSYTCRPPGGPCG